MSIVSEQVKIMLERMDLYPEEFVRPGSTRVYVDKWYDILHKGHFNYVEKFLIRRKYEKLKRSQTQLDIMEAVVKTGESFFEEEPTPYFDTVSRASQSFKEDLEAEMIMNAPRMRMKQK